MPDTEESHDALTTGRGHEQYSAVQSPIQSSPLVNDIPFGSSPPRKAGFTLNAGQLDSPMLPSIPNAGTYLAGLNEVSQPKCQPFHPTLATDKHDEHPKIERFRSSAQVSEICIMPPPLTLLERTRQSMSLLPNPAGPGHDHSRKSMSKQPRQSQLFPVNQFETPRKRPTMDVSLARMDRTRSGSSTPRDHLFSEEADYASVFKSRPKIALSPALSPDRSDFGLNSMLEEDLGDLTLANDV